MLFVLSCESKQYVSQEQMHAYALEPANGLIRTHMDERITVDVVYRPKDLIVYQMVDTVDRKQVDRVRASLSGLDYFILRVSPGTEGRPLTAIPDILQEDITLTTRGQTFHPESLTKTLFFDGSGSTSYLVVFGSSLEERSGETTFALERGLFNSGRMEFQFSNRDVQNAPRLAALKDLP